MNRSPPRIVICLMLWRLSALPVSGQADEIATPQLTEVIAHWAAREQRLQSLRIEWRRAPTAGADRFARSESEWAPATPVKGDPSAADVRLHGPTLLHSSWRTAAGPHGYDAAEVDSITAAIGQAYPERLGTPYTRALLGRFADQDAERRPMQRFHRSFDGAALHDVWDADPSTYPRATLHAVPEYGTAAWAVFEYEEDVGDQLQTLDLMAALLAVQPRHPLAGVRVENLRILPDAVIVDGAECIVCEETLSADGAVTRTLMLDPARESVLRRYIATASGEGVQVDVAYAQDATLGWLPAAWTVMRFAAADRPVQQLARAIVTHVAAGAPITADELSIEHRRGTWVVDRRSHESYLVREAGARRIVTDDELRWLPTYDELVQTETGEVGVLIERRVRMRERWRLAKWPLLIAATMLCAAVASKWRNSRRRNVES